MVKEIERAGLPVVHICTVTLGNPALNHEEEKKLRRKLVEKALRALTTEVEDQTIFED